MPSMHIREKKNATVGERVRAVGMIFYKRGDLEVGKVYCLRRNPNLYDENCVEIVHNGCVLATLNRNLAANIKNLILNGLNERW